MRFYSLIKISTVFILLLSFFACENDEHEISKITKSKFLAPTMVGKDVTADYRDSGLLVLKMNAKELKQFEINVPEPYYEAAKGLKVFFYNKEGKQVSTLSAEYGIFYERSQKVEVRYKVVVVNDEGKRMETEKLWWKQNDSIRSDGQVIMYENGKKLVGNKLVATDDFSHMELYDITAVLPFEEPKKDSTNKR